MGSFHKLISRYAKFLLDHRWLILLLLGSSALLFEILEHRGVDDPIDAHFVREVLFFSIIYPIVVGLLLNWLLRAQDERNAMMQQRAWETRLQQELHMAGSWEEMVGIIVHFPRVIAPFVGISLLHRHPQESSLERTAESWLGEALVGDSEETAVTSSPCGVPDHVIGQELHRFTSPLPRSSALHGYCLPLWCHDRFTGLLHFYLPITQQLSPMEILLFNHLAPVISQAMETAALENPDFIQATAARRERQRVARQLHETLAQDLSYLRLKLERLTFEDTLRSDQTTYQNLERLLDVADEAYVQVRNAIIALRSNSRYRLSEDLLFLAQQTAGRGEFTLHHQIQGDARPLPPLTQHKIVTIFREALTNVEQHARAVNVRLTITWSTTHLHIRLEDDGIGFDYGKPAGNGCLGLLIMQRRAAELEGQLSIRSQWAQGTRVTFQYPLAVS